MDSKALKKHFAKDISFPFYDKFSSLPAFPCSEPSHSEHFSSTSLVLDTSQPFCIKMYNFKPDREGEEGFRCSLAQVRTVVQDCWERR